MKQVYLLLAILMISVFPVLAQEDGMEDMALKDSTYIRKKNYPQQYDYENYTNSFPAKKKNMWAIGLQFGSMFVAGDVDPNYWKSGGIGLTVQKALGHVFSLRFQATYGKMYGQDWRPMSGATHNYRNYYTVFSDYSIQGVVSLNNINFYKRQPKVIIYALGGMGIATRFTKLDRQGPNDMDYDYSTIPAPSELSDRKDILDALNQLQDGTYETRLPVQGTDPSIKNTKINPSISLGGGISFRLSRRIDLNLEYRLSWHADDFYDGSQLRRSGDVSGGKDFVHFGTFGMVVKIGKRQEPLWWVNPLLTPYDDIRELKAELQDGDFKKDSDSDGVSDLFDQELNTPPNVRVDTKGRTLDSDDDGIPDHLDNEPYTVKGSPISEDGVALDQDRDGVPDIFDMEPNSKEGALVDAKGIDISYADLQEKEELANIYFDLNSSKIDSRFYPELYQVAKYLEENPDAKVVAEGHTDQTGNDNYNKELSMKRAESAVQFLVKNFKIDEKRIEIEGFGKEDPLVPGLPSKYDRESEAGYYMNRRVSFKVKE